MKRIASVLAVSLMTVGFFAEARNVSNAFLEFFGALQERSANQITRRFGIAYLEAVEAAQRMGIKSAKDLSDNGFIVLKGDSKSQSSIVISTIGKERQAFRAFNALANSKEYKSEGEIVVGIATPASQQQAKYIRFLEDSKTLLPLERAKLLTAMVKLDSEMISAVERTALDFGMAIDDLKVGLVRTIQTNDGYVLIRDVRINANHASANQIGETIERLSEMLPGYPHQARYVNP